MVYRLTRILLAGGSPLPMAADTVWHRQRLFLIVFITIRLASYTFNRPQVFDSNRAKMPIGVGNEGVDIDAALPKKRRRGAGIATALRVPDSMHRSDHLRDSIYRASCDPRSDPQAEAEMMELTVGHFHHNVPMGNLTAVATRSDQFTNSSSRTHLGECRGTVGCLEFQGSFIRDPQARWSDQKGGFDPLFTH
jgi:hypothetical protein